MILQMTELGWNMQIPKTWAGPSGELWAYGQGSAIQPLLQQVRTQVKTPLWDHALQHRHSDGLTNAGPDLTVVKKHYHWYITPYNHSY